MVILIRSQGKRLCLAPVCTGRGAVHTWMGPRRRGTSPCFSPSPFVRQLGLTPQPRAATSQVFPHGEQGDVRSRRGYFYSSSTSIFAVSVTLLFVITLLWVKVSAWSCVTQDMCPWPRSPAWSRRPAKSHP